MRQKKYFYQYAVLNQSGRLSKRLPLECKYPNPRGAATCAAEDYESLPESTGAAWPLTFIVYHLDGAEFCRYQIKRWHVPHFLITSGIGPDLPQ